MSGASWSGSLRLPQCWPRRVRSAVTQIISLAKTFLALTPGLSGLSQPSTAPLAPLPLG